LSSIEAVAVLDADVLAMQNWEHVLQVFELLNKRPAVDRGTDYARVRLHLLEDDTPSSKEKSSPSVPPGSRFRQTIIVSSVLQSQVSGLLLRCCGSHAGKIRVRPVEGATSSSAATLRVSHPQLFQRVTCNSGFRGADDDRFAYVTKTVIPAMQRSKQARTLLFVPSYFDFVRIRNYLIELGQKFVAIHEYARPSEVSRSRSRFFQGRVPLMIYTGRAHFFSRYLIRGVSHVIFYSLPDHGHIYAELVGCLDEAKSSNMKTTSIALYTKYDSLCLAGIVGDDSARQMTTSQKSSFVFA
jgi:U3 small nucleolar RNA-associated protein 25